MITLLEYLISKLIKKLHLRAILNCKIHSTSHVNAGSHLVNVYMDKYSDIGYDCNIYNTNIGSFCSLGASIKIGGASHSIDWISTSTVFNENKDSLKKKFSNHSFNPTKGTTTIGNDVYIGDNVMIKAGVTVGHGVVIGMGSIVTKNIPPYEIWGGNPAKLIRKRFDEDTILKLITIKWWDWEEEKIEKYAKHFNDRKKFIENFNKELT